jgi:hypothetical protein
VGNSCFFAYVAFSGASAMLADTEAALGGAKALVLVEVPADVSVFI